MENRAAIPLAKYEELQYRYDNLLESKGLQNEQVDELIEVLKGYRERCACQPGHLCPGCRYLRENYI